MKVHPLQPPIQKVKDVIRLRDPQAKNLALDLGLLPGHQDYVKFIILGRSRTGSNFLRGMLDAHPNVRVFGELFQNPQEITWGLPSYPQTKRLYQQFQTAPVQFIKSQIFRKVPTQVSAVGFKIFYYHAQEANWKPVWNYLLENQELHILHIKRRNMLETHLSKVRAEHSGQWANITGKKEQARPVRLDYEALLADFNQTSRWEQDYDELFSSHPKLEVIYEDLAQDYAAGFERVQAFLHLPACPAAPQTFKQSSIPLSDAITNYAELKESFAGSKFESFFEDRAT